MPSYERNCPCLLGNPLTHIEVKYLMFRLKCGHDKAIQIKVGILVQKLLICTLPRKLGDFMKALVSYQQVVYVFHQWFF